MRAKIVPFVITAFCAAAAWGQAAADQNQVRVFYFTHTDSVLGFQEIATLIGEISDIEEPSVDEAHRSLTVHGTAAQIGLAAWLFDELDQSTDRLAASQPGQALVTHEYRMPDTDDVVGVIYPTYAVTMQSFQEVATLVRSTADIRRLFTYMNSRAVAFRGTADQIGLAEWLFNALNKPANAGTLEYGMRGAANDFVRVFYLTNTATVQDFQEVAVTVRSIGDIRRLFTYNAPKALAARGTADQMALAAWLIGELDKPANWRAQAASTAASTKDTATHEYSMSDSAEGVVHVYYLTDIATVQRFQEIVKSIRTSTNIRRAFTYNAPRAVAFRGTADQIVMAGRLIQEQYKP